MNKKYLFSILILIIGVVLCSFAVNYVNTFNKINSSLVPDYFHSHIAFHAYYSIIAELALVIALVLFLYYVLKNKKYDSFFLFCMALGIFYLIRALLIFLNPIGNPYPYPDHFGILYLFSPGGGMFPSGHTGFVFLLFFVIAYKDKLIKYLMLGLAIITALFLIVARGHYTMDIIGSIFISYGVYVFVQWMYDSPKKKNSKKRVRK